ncbi:extracellular solute-binding protein [Nocardioides ungokensis]|uniref:extracellular solute-binding protein n=1 Tax=Nocardioides ungokensis TaxID=1643322 RepID=UPI0015DFF6FE|nr:extracellular solute-binding protein [Nocardioides ungokensis]
MKHPPNTGRRSRRHRRRGLAAAACLVTISGLLAACSSSGSGKTQLVWYINPDSGGQAKVAANCSTDQYTITTQVLPQDANEQRIQLARRLAAQDSGIDIMSIDPPFTAEFSNAGFLAPLPQSLQDKLSQQSFKSATDAATWDGKMVVAPFWSNTQVLWYRKSFVQKAGIDMSKPVTWDQIINAAAANGGKVAVQSNKYEGYVVWINALISGAGGEIATDTTKGLDMKLEINSPAGEKAAAVIEKLAHSSAAPADMSVAQEGQAGTTFATPQGSFMVNWTYIYNNYEATDPGFNKDIGYTRYPETVQGEPSRPPYGGIGLGVSAYSNHVDQAMKAVECLTSPENQEVNAEITGNMPASQAGYEANGNALQKIYPAPLLKLFQQSLDEAAPRTRTPYWSDISGGLQSTWHPPSGVSSSTPATSQTFIDNVLHGRSLL